MTYPTLRGDLKMRNKHVGVNFDDRHLPEKKLPDLNIQQQTQGTALEQIVKNLQSQNIVYNRKFYDEEAFKYEKDPNEPAYLGEDGIDDPRSLADMEKENMDLKE